LKIRISKELKKKIKKINMNKNSSLKNQTPNYFKMTLKYPKK
jgi:hypothetical protein